MQDNSTVTNSTSEVDSEAEEQFEQLNDQGFYGDIL